MFTTSCVGLKSISGYKNISCVMADTVTAEDKIILDIAKYKIPEGKTYGHIEYDGYSDYVEQRGKGYFRIPKYDSEYYKIPNYENGIQKLMNYDSLGRITSLTFVVSEIIVGREYYFDESGNITEIKDNNEGYSICWQQAIYIGKRYVGKRSGGRLAKTDKFYNEDTELDERRNAWMWIYYKKYGKKRGTRGLIFDGNTGELLRNSGPIRTIY